jgi:predicted helicase
MAHAAALKPVHKALKKYYEDLKAYSAQRVEHEGALETAFSRLLADTARPHGWTLIPKLSMKGKKGNIAPDGTLRDEYELKRGFWEAKDTHDDLDEEIGRKIAKGYPLSNIIFEDTRQAVLYQNGREINRFNLHDPQKLADLLNDFYAWTEPEHDNFEKAVEDFKERVPDLARGLDAKIKAAHKENPKFQAAFASFFTLCQETLNPNISRDAVDEMLVQHLLTERLFRTIFKDPDFTRRNVIAAEVERVIDALTSQAFSRAEFLKSLDRFYKAIEAAADTLEEFAEKQHFLNTVYERFFQGYSVKLADTHGIVYTPQEIVDFMCASVEEVLHSEFGLTLGSPGVNILDPCTGTGNFIVNILRRIPKRDLPRVYKEQLFANEVMLLPYYIAALNIEHAYYEITNQYEAFEGLCFVDTLELGEQRKGHRQTVMFSEANTERVERQKKTPITVIIGNPPYNAHQVDENDNSKNRKYPAIDGRIRQTYAKDSTATNKNALSDPYVKFFRWAADRLNERDGIVCFVSNNSFLDQIAFDGMRKHLMEDFTHIFHLHLEGNVRHNPKLAGTTYNVFGIQVGVGITIAVRSAIESHHRLDFHRVDKLLRREQKLAWLGEREKINGIAWQTLQPDSRNTWLVPENADEFATFLPMGDKASRESKVADVKTVFKLFSVGVKTNRDEVVYDFSRPVLIERTKRFVDDYNSELDRFKRSTSKLNVDDFVRYDKIKWSETLKANIARGRSAEFREANVRLALYRPFCKRSLYYNEMLVERRYQFPWMFPTVAAESENQIIGLTDLGSEKPFMTMIAAGLADIHLVGGGSAAQCFPFYVYDEDGSNRRENITDWALAQFRAHYANEKTSRKRKRRPPAAVANASGSSGTVADASGSEDREITKWDIFYYVYGLLHHPGYRTKFADNLKRELPRIPFAPDFWAFANAGRELARLHLDYEKLEPYPLKFIETEGAPLSYGVEDKMRLSKDKTELKINASLTLRPLPAEAFQYRLGNRSALDWVIDQYQVSEDKRSGIRSDPNRADDPEYIVRLVGQVVRVSLETVAIVNALPEKYAE